LTGALNRFIIRWWILYPQRLAPSIGQDMRGQRANAGPSFFGEGQLKSQLFLLPQKPTRPRPNGRDKSRSRQVSLLIRHKMLCPSADKIMPDDANRQDFVGIFLIPLYKLKTMRYKTFPTKCFKKR
jgi:hypothetical protein